MEASTLTRWIRSPGRLLLLFIVTGVLLVCTLLWLGWELGREDRRVASQRMQEQRDSAADLAVLALRRSVVQAEERVADVASAAPDGVEEKAARTADALPDDAVLVVVRGARMDAYPSGRLPFYPAGTAPPRADAVFARADRLEFRSADSGAAVALLQQLLRTGDAATRASALLRLARIDKKRGNQPSALARYERLLAMGQIPVAECDGLAAELVARQARLEVLVGHHQAAAQSEANTLVDGLRQHRWRLTRGQWEFYASQGLTALGHPGQAFESPEAVALASVVETAYDATLPYALSSVVRRDGFSFLVLCSQGQQDATLILGRHWLRAQLGGDIGRILRGQSVELGLTAPDGSVVVGPSTRDSRVESVRLAATTRLPWNVHAISVNPGAEYASAASRRRVIAAGLVAIGLLFLAGTVLIGRSVARDVAVSRQQSDFVAAVSHDFRTPLSSLCLISDMLHSGRVRTEADRSEYYEVLARESQRLRRLVEGLLNFGRAEAGAMQYQFDTVDPVEVVREVVDEFQRDVQQRGYAVTTSIAEATPLVRADRAALGCALWNLLDNAVKYSPQNKTVCVELAGNSDVATIKVRDRGVGIPAAEQGRIFEKFVRGRTAEQAAVVGTGVGLALVRHTVTAHRGRVTVQSEPGEGSSFTIELPAFGASASQTAHVSRE